MTYKKLVTFLRGWNWKLIGILAFALGLRLVYTQDVWVGIQGDAVEYVQIAEKFYAQGFDGPSAVRPPFYPFLLAVFAKIFNAQPNNLWLYAWLNCILDLISIVLLFRIGKRVHEATAYLGIILITFNPLWFGHVNSPVTEPIAVTLFLAFLDRWTKEKRTQRDEIWAGLFLGMLTLSRGMFLLFPFALLAFEFFMRKVPKGFRIEGSRRWVFLAAAMSLPFGWGVRNQIVLGQFIMTQTESTFVVMAWNGVHDPLLDWRIEKHRNFQKNHPWSDVLLGRSNPQRKAEVYALMKEDVKNYIFQHPLEYVGLMFPKAWRLWVDGWWNPFSYAWSPSYLRTVYIGGFCLPVLIFGMIGLFRQWREKLNASQWRATRIQLLTAVYITAVTVPLTVDARYSLPSLVCFAIWTGLGITAFGTKK